jgi:hypothetical protein
MRMRTRTRMMRMSPSRRSLSARPFLVSRRLGRPKKPQLMSREDLQTIVTERFEDKWTSYDIFNWLNRENIISAETGEALTVRQIGGYKGLISSARREAYVSGEAPPPLPNQVIQTLPQIMWPSRRPRSVLPRVPRHLP